MRVDDSERQGTVSAYDGILPFQSELPSSGCGPCQSAYPPSDGSNSISYCCCFSKLGNKRNCL